MSSLRTRGIAGSAGEHGAAPYRPTAEARKKVSLGWGETLKPEALRGRVKYTRADSCSKSPVPGYQRSSKGDSCVREPTSLKLRNVDPF